MIDIDKVLKIKTPADDLINIFRNDLDVSKFIKFHKFKPFTSYVTLALVTDPDAIKLSKKYIIELLRNQSKYGFLYFLNTKKLIIPLILTFNGDLIIDPQNHYEISKVLNEIARDFACPNENEAMYEITKIELLYFFTLLVNNNLTWVTVDHILKCNKFHTYLYAAPERLIK